MRDALIAFPCTLILLAFYWNALGRGATPAGFQAIAVIAAGFALAWVAWVFLEQPKIVAQEQSLLRQQRRANGECMECGYALTGNASGVCPECGSAERQ